MTEPGQDAHRDGERLAADYEPAAAGVPVSPVGAARPRSGLRWGLALGLAAVIMAVSAAGAWLLTGSDAGSGLAAWMPADSVVYEELRFDLPGDQRQQLGTFLAHFPGFDDQAILDQKLAEVYDRIIRAATGDRHDFSTDIEPWFGGQVAFALGALPEVAPSGGASPQPDVRALVAVSVTDPAAALDWVRRVLGEAGTSPTTVDHGGSPMLVVGSSSTQQAAAAARGEVLLLGDRHSVERSLDANGSGGLASSDAFRTAQAASGGDRLAGVYVDLRAYVAWAARISASAAPSAGAMLQSLTAGMPAWLGASLHAEGDALVGEAAVPHADALPAPANAPTALADHLPSSTLFAYDVNDYGATLLRALDLYRANPALSAAMADVGQVVGRLGGFDALLGWIGEAAVVVGEDGGQPTAGVVVAPRDRAAADQLAVQVRNLLTLAGGSSGLVTRDEPYAGTTITTVEPTAPAGAAGSHLAIAWAVTDQVVVIGLGDGFVKQVLDTKAGSSLGADARFRGLVARVGDHDGLLFADVARIRQLLEAGLPASERQAYEANVKPYLVPFDAVVGGSRRGSDLDTVRLLLTVSQ